MNTKLFILTVGTLLLVSCGHEADLVESREAYKEVVTQTNAEKVFGVKFDPNHDWCTTVNGQVMITADASVKKVQLLVNVLDITDETTPSYVTRNSMAVLNQAETKGRTNFMLYYDAPKDNLGLYVAFITDESLYLRKVENGAASFTSPAKTRATKLDNGYTLPNASQFYVAGSEASWASKSEQGWNPGEVLYYLNDYTSLEMTAEGGNADYSGDFKTSFKDYIIGLLPNGRWKDAEKTIPNDNTPGKVYNTVEYNNNCYVETDGEQPVILTPMYKCDHPTKYGYEVWNSDLYYYYYDPAKVSGDFTSYIKSLPKYKAIPFKQVFDKTEDEVVGKHGSFALLYFETPNDQTPATANTPASFIFPKGYKIGFMIKANTDADDGQKRGELYGDGRLNNNINKWGNFASSGFGADDKANFPRLYWLTFENKKFMAWESGTDCDFNDIFVEVEGGKVVPDIPVPDPKVFTYCFEDTEQGDFDLNDVVIKAIRVDETAIEYRLVACGAHDEVTVMNLNVAPIVDGAEVHKLFGVDAPKTFINTDGSNYGYVSCTKTVPADFSLLKAAQQPYIHDITTNVDVFLAKKGQNPHGILIPWDFLYPTERTPVKTAYPDFNTWGTNSILSSDWYKNPIRSLVR